MTDNKKELIKEVYQSTQLARIRAIYAAKIEDALPETIKEPMTQTGFAEKYGVTARVVRKWDKELRENEKPPRKVKADDRTDKEKFIGYLEEKIYTHGTATAKEIEAYITVKGWKVDKQEIALVTISGDDHFRIAEAARERASELELSLAADRDGSVSAELPVLPSELREDSQ